MPVHLVFDVGGTLIFDPFEETLQQLSQLPRRNVLEGGLLPTEVDAFLDRWKYENTQHNFPFAGHFLQEEVFIARAAWPSYARGAVSSKERFPLWTIDVLLQYRQLAAQIIARQPHLVSLRRALAAARQKGYHLSVASNDRFGSTAAMLAAAGILEYFDFVATSEGLSFEAPGAEKPSFIFFDSLQNKLGLNFQTTRTFYIGDDETRDIRSTVGLPIRSVRFFGNNSSSTNWLDNFATTQADLQFHNYEEFLQLISEGAFETHGPKYSGG